MSRPLNSPLFWVPCLATAIVVGLFFGWELNLFPGILPSLARPPATSADFFFTILLGLMLALTSGLAAWNTRYGHCPVGTKRATGVAGVLGAITLLCPVCLVLPVSLLGLSAALAFLAPFLPLLRMIAIVLLAVTVWMLRPRRIARPSNP